MVTRTYIHNGNKGPKYLGPAAFIIIIVMSALVGTLLIWLCFYCYRKRSNRKKAMKEAEELVRRVEEERTGVRTERREVERGTVIYA